MSAPQINTARQRRAISALIRGPVASFALKDIAGQLNAPDVIYSLRRLGWKIATERFTFKDRDGRAVYPGRYCLAPEMKALAIEALSGKEAEETAATVSLGDALKKASDSCSSEASIPMGGGQ